MKALVYAIFVGVVFSSSPVGLVSAAEKAQKEDGHKHDDKDHKSHHGGVVSHVGHHEYELVAKADTLTLYLSEDEKPVPSKGATASVMLMAGTEKNTVKLEPAGDNKLEAKGTFKIGKGMKVLATVNLPGKKPEQIRFTLK